MPERRFIVLGDKTNHGGTVVGAWGADCPETKWKIDGRPVACVGDPVICPQCKGVHRIIQGADDPPVWFGGRQVATEKCAVSDGSFLMSIQQFNATHGDEGDGVSAAAAYQRAVAEMAKRATNVDRAAAENGFCLECWLKANARHDALMPDTL